MDCNLTRDTGMQSLGGELGSGNQNEKSYVYILTDESVGNQEPSEWLEPEGRACGSKTCCEGKKDKEKELRAKEKEERAKEWVQKAKQKADVKAARHAAKGERSSKKGIKSTALSVEFAETFVVLGTR
ncbi:hypothetical protein PC129_g17339 [Phytophthora cactorum]|uniref:Uncharacterized protein n=1 Tax=Phytophthora cactorum TaxID=29920 RepID=A0A8T1HI17_9STRA|nr:hypothetical protein PC129_g17339 [Phytophthora cactorum]